MKKAVDNLFLCLDQGGHASRALVIDAAGDIHSESYRDIGTRRAGDRVEHDPEELVATLLESAAEAVAKLGDAAGAITTAGLATQRSSIVCWDRVTGRPLSPVLSWQDTRAADWLVPFQSESEQVHRVTGLVLSPYYGVSKLRWCMDSLDAVREAHCEGRLVFGPLASFLAQRLVNGTQPLADPANASRTLLWDRRSRDWSRELTSLFDVPRDCLPQCVPSQHIWGDIGVSGRRIPLRIVTGDQSAALFAFGRPDPATVYANLGTGAFLQQAFGTEEMDPGGLLASVVFQDDAELVQVMEGTVNGAGSAINLVAGQLDIDKVQLRAGSADWLREFSGDWLFLNTVSGLGSPWWVSEPEPRFEPADSQPSPEEAIAAVLESIAFLLAVNLECLRERLGAPGRLLATGGLASVDPLLQALADLSGTEIHRAVSREATARGLAFLLAEGSAGWPQARSERIFKPVPNEALLKRFDHWKTLMPRS